MSWDFTFGSTRRELIQYLTHPFQDLHGWRIVLAATLVSSCAIPPGLPVFRFGEEYVFRHQGPLGDRVYTWSADPQHGRTVFQVRSEGLPPIVWVFDQELRWVETWWGGQLSRSADPHDGSFVWPLEVGKQWVAQYTYTDHLQTKQFEVVVAWEVETYESVTVPAGTFWAYRVVGVSPVYREVFWYAPRVGFFVKGRYEYFPDYYLGKGVEQFELLLVQREGKQ